MNSTETYWEIDGVSIQTYAYNIQTLGGDRKSPPPLRGKDVTIPGAPGQVWVTKVPDAKTLTLGMWIIGAQIDGSAPANGDARRQFDANWDKLRTLMWTPRRQVSITKRFWRNGVLVTATGMGQFAGGLEPTMRGPAGALFTVDFRMADPFFYGPTQAVTFTPNTSKTITVPGDERTLAISFEVIGASTNPRLTNETITDFPVWMEYRATLGSTMSALMDVRGFRAEQRPNGYYQESVLGSGSYAPSWGYSSDFTETPAGSGNYVPNSGVTAYPKGSKFYYPASRMPTRSSGRVFNDGDTSWMILDPGTQKLRYSSSAGTANAILRYQPVYL